VFDTMNRRNFILGASGTLLTMAAGNSGNAETVKTGQKMKSRVALVKGQPRSDAIGRAIDMLGINPVTGRKVLIKPNFNTADPFPASTHNDTLVLLIEKLRSMGAVDLTIGERCGPSETAQVLRDKGVDIICKEYDVPLVNFEELPANKWHRVKPDHSHWHNGFDVAQPVLDAECVVSTCCLKTHGYGGVFTMSLKLSVGITHKRNMGELHGSTRDMRKMIAEINQVYEPSLILMDGMEVFTDGGPMHGKLERADVIIAGADRIAVDAVGLAVLKELGANRQIMGTNIFAQEQIVRAVELGLGVSRPQDIELLTDDSRSSDYAGRLRDILLQG
jgi:uncharacterized protein (DUF362 family)